LDILVKDKNGELYMVPNTAFEDWMFVEEKARMVWRNKQEQSSARFRNRS